MAYKDFVSKTEDVVWLAYQLKNELGSKISINKMGLYKEFLEGRYNLEGHNRGIDFGILYSDKEFLRVSVGEIDAYDSSYEDKVLVLNELKNAIGSIIRDGISLGEPTIFYNVRDEKYMIPHLEYVYADKEKTIKAFQDQTIFDDGSVPEDVIVFDLKKTYEFLISKGYSCMIPGTSIEWSIGISGVLINKSNIDEKELRNIIIDNLDDIFNKDNSIKGNLFDISYIALNIKNALYMVEEKELSIIIKINGKDVFFVNYNGGILSYYNCNCEYKGSMSNICYTPKSGVTLNMKSDVGACGAIEDVVRNQFTSINDLNNTNNQYNVKSNNNLLKLVRRIGNK